MQAMRDMQLCQFASLKNAPLSEMAGEWWNYVHSPSIFVVRSPSMFLQHVFVSIGEKLYEKSTHVCFSQGIVPGKFAGAFYR